MKPKYKKRPIDAVVLAPKMIQLNKELAESTQKKVDELIEEYCDQKRNEQATALLPHYKNNAVDGAILTSMYKFPEESSPSKNLRQIYDEVLANVGMCVSNKYVASRLDKMEKEGLVGYFLYPNNIEITRAWYPTPLGKKLADLL